jgi:hypothetical protein
MHWTQLPGTPVRMVDGRLPYDLAASYFACGTAPSSSAMVAAAKPLRTHRNKAANELACRGGHSMSWCSRPRVLNGGSVGRFCGQARLMVLECISESGKVTCSPCGCALAQLRRFGRDAAPWIKKRDRLSYEGSLLKRVRRAASFKTIAEDFSAARMLKHRIKLCNKRKCWRANSFDATARK